jgi:hypothetical protein
MSEKKYVLNTGVAIDDTDHFAFLCPRCKKVMEVVSSSEEMDDCTVLELICEKCDLKSQRKIYWKEDGKFLRPFFVGDKK